MKSEETMQQAKKDKYRIMKIGKPAGKKNVDDRDNIN